MRMKAYILAAILLCFTGCGETPSGSPGKYEDKHWLALGTFLVEFPTSCVIYWPETLFEGARGNVVRGDSCYLSFSGDGSISGNRISEYLTEARTNGAIDTLKEGRFLLVSSWKETEAGFTYEAVVVPSDTSLYNLGSVFSGHYWKPASVASCPDQYLTMAQVHSIRTTLAGGFVPSCE